MNSVLVQQTRRGLSPADGRSIPEICSQGVRLTVGNIQDLVKSGEMRNAGSDLTRFADGLLPGRSLWYARLAWERYLTDEIQAWVDGPDAAKKFRRIKKNARKEFDQRFWWRPGDPLPERAPDLAAAGGQ